MTVKQAFNRLQNQPSKKSEPVTWWLQRVTKLKSLSSSDSYTKFNQSNQMQSTQLTNQNKKQWCLTLDHPMDFKGGKSAMRDKSRDGYYARYHVTVTWGNHGWNWIEPMRSKLPPRARNRVARKHLIGQWADKSIKQQNKRKSRNKIWFMLT